MQIQSIGNNRPSLKFSADADVEKAKAFVNMNDAQLKTLAYVTTHDKNAEKKRKKSMLSALYALPMAASLSSGILTKGKLGTRLVATGRTAGSWGFALLVLGAFNSAKNAIVSRSEKLQKFESNNPIISLLADIGLFMGALTLGNKGVGKLVSKKLKKSPVISLVQNAKRLVNKSKLNTKVLPSILKTVENVGAKAPWALAAATTVVANSVLIVFIAGIMRGKNSAKESKKDLEKNYRELKTAQLKTAKHLTNVLAVRNDVLAQGSPIASELKEHVV